MEGRLGRGESGMLQGFQLSLSRTGASSQSRGSRLKHHFGRRVGRVNNLVWGMLMYLSCLCEIHSCNHDCVPKCVGGTVKISLELGKDCQQSYWFGRLMSPRAERNMGVTKE